MGRYYSGDIEGKFWFGVQSSEAADRFGGDRYEPNVITYNFDDKDIPKVEKELDLIKSFLGDHLPKLEDFFNKHNGYTTEQLMKALIVDRKKADLLLREYADYLLGNQILDCLKKSGNCGFEAEL